MLQLPFFAELVVVLISVFVSVYLYYKNVFNFFKNKGIPYLEPKFPKGNINSFFLRGPSVGYISAIFYNELKKKGCKFGGIFAGPRPMVVVLDLDLVKSVLSKDFEYFTDRGMYFCRKNCLSASLFTFGGKEWKDLRVKLTPTFTSGKMKIMFSSVLAASDNMVQALETRQRMPLDIREIAACFTTDVIGSVAFGLECNSFKGNEAKFRTCGKKMLTGSVYTSIKGVLGLSFPKICSYFNMSVFSSDVRVFFTQVIRDTVKLRTSTNTRRNDFLQILMDMMQGSGGKGLTLHELVTQCSLFFIAGFETSSTLISFAIYELAKNQEAQNTLREEVRNAFAKDGGNLTYETLMQMKYLSQVADETLRLYPPAAGLDRQCVKDYKIPDTNITLEKGTKILISAFGLQHDPEHFPEPEKFIPERFSEENKSSIPPYAYVPFGEGPRNCIGMRFGLMQSKIGISRLVKDFHFTVHPTMKPVEFNDYTFNLTTKNDLILQCTKI